MTRQAIGRVWTTIARGSVVLCLAALLLSVGMKSLPGLAQAGGIAPQSSVELSSWAWTLVNPAGFGVCQPVTGCDNVRIRALAAYDNQLIAGTTNATMGAEIWGYNGASWTRQVSGGMGDILNSAIVSMAAYSGTLYAGTQQDESSGAEVWSYDGLAWTRALTGGFDQSALPSDPKNIAASALTPFDAKLYIGTRYEYGGAQIWAYDGLTVTQVVSNGLANSGNVAVVSLAPFAGDLYAGTLNKSGAELWRSANGLQWTRVVTDGFGSSANTAVTAITAMSQTLFAATENQTAGAEVWRSDNGQVWERILSGGLGDSGLYTVNALTVYKGMLYAAVRHSSQPLAEVWAYDGQAWQRAVSGGLSEHNRTHTFYEAGALAVLGDTLYLGTSEGLIGSFLTSPEIWSSSGPLPATPTPTSSPTPIPATPTATPTATATALTTATRTATPTATATAIATPGTVRVYLPIVIR